MSDDTPEKISNRSAPPGNGNAEKHSLYSDRELLYQRLSPEEQRLVVAISQDLMERIPGEIGAYERESLRNVSVDMVKRRRANEYIVSEDTITDGDDRSEKLNKAYSRLVRDITKELEKLGILTDSPEHRKADAQQGWMDALGEASRAREK